MLFASDRGGVILSSGQMLFLFWSSCTGATVSRCPDRSALPPVLTPCRCFSAPVRDPLPLSLRTEIGLFCFFDAAGRSFSPPVRWSSRYALQFIQEHTNKGILQAVSGQPCPLSLPLADAFLSVRGGNCQPFP